MASKTNSGISRSSWIDGISGATVTAEIPLPLENIQPAGPDPGTSLHTYWLGTVSTCRLVMRGLQAVYKMPRNRLEGISESDGFLYKARTTIAKLFALPAV